MGANSVTAREHVNATQPYDEQFNPIGVLRPGNSIVINDGVAVINSDGIYRFYVGESTDATSAPSIMFSLNESIANVSFSPRMVEYFFLKKGTVVDFSNLRDVNVVIML